MVLMQPFLALFTETSVNSGIQHQHSATLNPLLDCTLLLMNQDLTMNSNLATKLRAGTQQSYIAPEQAEFMQTFLKGSVNKASFAKFLGNLYCIYRQLARIKRKISSTCLILES